MSRFILCALTTAVLLTLIWVRVQSGISLRGRWTVLIIVGFSIILHLWAIIGVKGQFRFKYRVWIIASFTTPVMAILMTFFSSPLLTLYTIGVTANLLGYNNPTYFSDESYRVTKAVSFMTDSSYEIYQKSGLLERRIGAFHSELDIGNAQVTIGDGHVTIRSGDQLEVHTYVKY